MSADLERLAAEFEKFQTRIKQAEVKFSGVVDMREQLADLEAVAVSPDRSVRVVAGAGGAITDIQLTPDAMRLPATTLSATIMTTLREAVADAVRKQAGIVDETVGNAFGISTTDQVREAQEQALGTAVDDLASHQDQSEPPAARPVRSDDEDDFSQDTLYDR